MFSGNFLLYQSEKLRLNNKLVLRDFRFNILLYSSMQRHEYYHADCSALFENTLEMDVCIAKHH